MYVQNIKYYRSRHDIMLISGLNHQTSKAVEEEVVTVSCNESTSRSPTTRPVTVRHRPGHVR
jgi:hypothetical protein